jgi:multiple sugar transport system permease protein
VNTLEVAMGTIISAILFNGLAGYVLSRLRPKGSKFILLVMLWTMMLPHSIAMVPLFKNILRVPLLHISLINTYWPMWLMAGANDFFILMFKSFFDGIPMTLVEAARLDGCNNLGIFRQVILPLSKPVLMVVLIFTLNGTWSDFFWPFLVLNDKNKFTVIVRIFDMRGGAGFSEDVVMAALTFAIVPPAILFIFFQKYIMQGFTMSGIKG